MTIDVIARVVALLFCVAATWRAGEAARRLYLLVPDDWQISDRKQRTRGQQDIRDAAALLIIVAVVFGVTFLVYGGWLWHAYTLPDHPAEVRQ